MKHHYFVSFGDQTLAAARASGLGYTTTDELRQDYTGYQKDNESVRLINKVEGPLPAGKLGPKAIS